MNRRAASANSWPDVKCELWPACLLVARYCIGGRLANAPQYPETNDCSLISVAAAKLLPTYRQTRSRSLRRPPGLTTERYELGAALALATISQVVKAHSTYKFLGRSHKQAILQKRPQAQGCPLFNYYALALVAFCRETQSAQSDKAAFASAKACLV